MILRVNRPKLRRHLEVPAQRGSSTLNANFVGKTDFAAVDAVRDRAASGRRAAGLEEGNFWDGDDLTEAVPRWGTGAVAAGSETGGKDTGGTTVVDRRGARSTVPALINIFDRMLFNLDDKRVYGLVLADFQKAFDLVSHNIPIEKLRIYGLDEFSLGLIRSFLHNRRQRTVIRGSAQSSSQTLMHGVPQGSVLSPLLFLVFINDLLRECRNQPQLTSSQMIRHTQILPDYVLSSVTAPVNSRTGLEITVSSWIPRRQRLCL